MVYQPEEDSYLLEKEVKNYLLTLKNKNITILDMGAGSGIQAKACIKWGIKKSKVFCADIDKETLSFLKSQKLKVIKSNLFNKITKSFDLIIFNAPYLPEDKYDKEIDTTAGKEGYEIILRFLKQAKTHLNKEGIILLLFSSLSKPKIILKEAKLLKYHIKKLAEKGIGMMETLFVYELQ